MNQNQLLRQMIDMNRTAFENAFNVMTMIQEQGEKTASACLKQATWLPGEGHTVVDQWMKACKNGRESFKSSVDEGFKKVDAFIADMPKGE